MGDPYFADQAMQWFLSVGIKYILGALAGCVIAWIVWMCIFAVWDVLSRWWRSIKDE